MVLRAAREAFQKYGLIETGERIVVGVSGGPDSLCLLHVLIRLQPEYGIALHAAHLDHGLRGPESSADAEYVGVVARQWGVPFTVERCDVAALARARHLAVEEAARRARYAFLAKVAVATGSTAIAVGHNADDQAETVLMHWLRGSGLDGLRGMQPKTRLGEYRLLEDHVGPEAVSADLWLIRPLLDVARHEILAYCEREGLKPRFDRSNLDTTYFRNWLRYTIFPLLGQHNPRVREVLCRSARVLADDCALLRRLLDEAWPAVVTDESSQRISFDLEGWRALPASLQRSSLREAIHRLRRTLRDIAFVHVEDAVRVAREGPTGRRATLPQGLELSVGYDRLTVAEAGAGEDVPDWPLLDGEVGALAVSATGCTPLPGSGWALHARILSRPCLPAGWDRNEDPWQAYVDWDRVVGQLWLRVRRPGDRFCPMGLGGSRVKLGDWLTNRKVPRAARARLPLLVDQAGLLWVTGQQLDERARVGEDTQRVLVLCFVRE